MSDTRYSIGDVAQLSGVGASTLRAWEARYGLVTPVRTGSSYRSYSDRDLEIIRRMRLLVESGIPPRRAATMASQPVPEPTPTPDGEPTQTGSPLGDHESLTRAATQFDADLLQQTLDEAFAVAAVERVIDDWLMPSLTKLGQAWEAGTVDVAAEHFVTAAVMRRLAGLFEATHAHGPRVVVGLPPGARHELPALAFAVCLRRLGLDVIYLGADVPLESWVAVVEASSPRAAVISAGNQHDVANADQTVQTLLSAGTEIVYVGGRAASLLQAGTPLPPNLSSAAELVRTALTPEGTRQP